MTWFSFEVDSICNGGEIEHLVGECVAVAECERVNPYGPVDHVVR